MRPLGGWSRLKASRDVFEEEGGDGKSFPCSNSHSLLLGQVAGHSGLSSRVGIGSPGSESQFYHLLPVRLQASQFALPQCPHR